jgi:acyl-CoA reductase-like NAD-dependent aldehyde dehydrogenase
MDTQTLGHFIGGEWTGADDALESRNPSNTDDVVARFPNGGAAEVDQAVAAQRLTGEIAEDARGAQRFANAFGAGLAFLAREQLAQLVRAREDQRGDFVEHIGARLGRGARPGREGCAGGGHSAVHVRRAAIGEAGDDLIGVGRVAAFQSAIGAGPFAADEMAERRHVHIRSCR